MLADKESIRTLGNKHRISATHDASIIHHCFDLCLYILSLIGRPLLGGFFTGVLRTPPGDWQ